MGFKAFFLRKRFGKPDENEMTATMRTVMFMNGILSTAFLIPDLVLIIVNRSRMMIVIVGMIYTVLCICAAGLFICSALHKNTKQYAVMAYGVVSSFSVFALLTTGGLLSGSKGMLAVYCTSIRLTLLVGKSDRPQDRYWMLGKFAVDFFFFCVLSILELLDRNPEPMVYFPAWLDIGLLLATVAQDTLFVALVVWINALQTRKILAVSESRLQFLTATSHEVRTPLNGLLGCLSVLKHSRGITKEHDYLISTAENSGTHLLMVLNDILDIGKIDSSKMELQKERVHICEEMRSAVSTGHHMSIKRNIQVTFFASRSVPEYIIGDSIRFRQILINLIQNAVKFTTEGYVHVHATVDVAPTSTGSLLTRNESRIFPEKAVEKILRIEVSDTGAGISASNLSKIFDRFGQGGSATFSRFGGTGLGLTLAKELAVMMGGNIIARSEGEGKGAVFEFEIPFTDSKDSSTERKYNTVSCSHPVWLFFSVRNHWQNTLQMYLDDWGVQYTLSPPDPSDGPVVVLTHESSMEDVSDALATYSITPLLIGILVDLTYEVPSDFDRRVATEKLTLPLKAAQLYNILTSNVGVGMERDSTTTNTIRPMNSQSSIRLAAPGTPDDAWGQADQPVYSVMSVLLADDLALNRKILRMSLERCGVRSIVEVENGQQAVEAFRREKFHVVFMDLEMPIMGGQDATRQIREFQEMHGHGSTVVVACTANAFPEVRRECLASGFDDFIVKPISIEVIREALARAYAIQYAAHIVSSPTTSEKSTEGLLRFS